jgi:Helix-turn-helix domain
MDISQGSRRKPKVKTLTEKIAGLSERRRKKVEARVAELVAEEMSLQDLRRAHRLTQARVGKTLKIGQDGVSRLEQRTDLLISTLRSYVEAMGGDLQLIASFPDRPAVAVTGLAGNVNDVRRLAASYAMETLAAPCVTPIIRFASSYAYAISFWPLTVIASLRPASS